MRKFKGAAKSVARGGARCGTGRSTVAALIREMTRRIVARFAPERIILFGSYAAGRAGPDSDVDLLVVMPPGGSRREKQLAVRAALHGLRIPKDVIVSAPEDYEWRNKIIGTIEYVAAKEGRILYAR